MFVRVCNVVLWFTQFQVLGFVLCRKYPKRVPWFGILPVPTAAAKTGPWGWKSFWKVGDLEDLSTSRKQAEGNTYLN